MLDNNNRFKYLKIYVLLNITKEEWTKIKIICQNTQKKQVIKN